jgi:hypothetical protein
MRTVIVAFAALAVVAQQTDELQVFKRWLSREHPGYGSDEGPARFRNATVEAAYPGRRFYYVHTYARGSPGGPRNPLSLVAQIDDHGAVMPLSLSSLATYRAGLRTVKTKEDARRGAAAVLILALGDPVQRSWKIEESGFRIERRKGGWVCSYSHGFNYVSRVTFDKQGTLTGIDPRTPPVG